jgi:hypothetical protein
MRALILTALLALAACATPTPPVPEPGPPDPDPGPAATSCERAEQRSRALGCSRSSESAAFVDACTRYETLGGDSRWQPDCMAQAVDCPALEACRSGQ